MKQVISFLLFGLFFVSAEGLIGHWQDANSNVDIKIYANSTYEITNPYQGSGQCGVQNNIFMMRDYNSDVVFNYSIQSIAQNQIVLYDLNNRTYLRLSRVILQQKLATSGKYVIKKEHVDVGISLVEFVIGQQIKPIEKTELQIAAVEEFKVSPQVFLQQIEQLSSNLQQLKNLTRPLDIGVARQQLISEIYKATRPIKKSEQPKIAQLINRYIKVVAYDEKENLVATDRDIRAFLSYLAFLHYLNGNDIQVTQKNEDNMYQQIINNFGKLGKQQKSVLCSASLIWKVIRVNWQRMSEQQKQKFRKQVNHQYTPAKKYTPVQKNPSEVTQNDLYQKQRELWHQQQMFNIMNDMSLQSHATTLNIIENMGGTGNYWEVK